MDGVKIRGIKKHEIVSVARALGLSHNAAIETIAEAKSVGINVPELLSACPHRPPVLRPVFVDSLRMAIRHPASALLGALLGVLAAQAFMRFMIG